MIGSERGFCGDFNESLVQALNANQPQQSTLLLAIGNKLETKYQNDTRITAFIEGHSVVEEVQLTLLRLTEVLNKLPHIGSVSVIYFDDESDEIRQRQLLPLAAPTTKSPNSHPPQLNLQPTEFLAQLTDQYLYAVLHEVFYSALMVENRMRQAHMDKAIQRLEKDESVLRLRYNRLRQEEITEEIEIIMLSVEALSDADD
jgi:F-type H+-transporting ATPase subunit gamma